MCLRNLIRQHVFQDLNPYACTYQDCELGEYFFQSRQEWFAHETTHHRLQWSCNVGDHPEFQSKADFETHMIEGHNKDIQKYDSTSIRDLFGKPGQSAEGICLLCENESKSLETHVGRHLEQLALFCIPRAYYLDDDDKVAPDNRSDESRRQIGRALSQDTDLSDLIFSDGEGQLETKRKENLGGKLFLVSDDSENSGNDSPGSRLDLEHSMKYTEPYPLHWSASGYQVSFDVPTQHSGVLMYFIELSTSDDAKRGRFLYRGGHLVELDDSDDIEGWFTSMASYVVTQSSSLTEPGELTTPSEDNKPYLKTIMGPGTFGVGEAHQRLASDNLRAGRERHIHMTSMVTGDYYSRKLPAGHIDTCCSLTKLLFDSTTVFEESNKEISSKSDLPRCAVLLKTSLFWGMLALRRYFAWDDFSTFITSDKLNDLFVRPRVNRDELGE